MKEQKRFFGVIPARYASSRFPGKPLVDIFGKPMIYWVCKRVQKSDLASDYTVATDDQRIFDSCRENDLPVIMTSTSCVNGTERVSEVAEKVNADVFINIQGDEPMLDPNSINAVMQLFIKDNSIEYAQAVKVIDDIKDYEDPTVVKVVVSKGCYALYLSRSRVPYPRTKDAFKTYKHIGVYGFKKAFLSEFIAMGESPLESIEGIEQLRALENGKKLKIVEVEYDTISVDTPRDLERILKEHGPAFRL